MKNNKSSRRGSWIAVHQLLPYLGSNPMLVAPVAVVTVAILASVAPPAAMSAGVTTQIRSVTGRVTVVTSRQSGSQKAQAGMTRLDAAEVAGEADSWTLHRVLSNHAPPTLIRTFYAFHDPQVL